MELSGKKVAVFVEQQYQELEVWYPYFRLKEAGAEAVFVGPEANTAYPSKCGYEVRSEQGIEKVNVDSFDAVVLPGGYAPDYMRRNENMVAFVREMHEAGKPVAAICHAGWMLVSANILSGKRATSVAAIKDDMKHAGAEWVDEECVKDGNLITARKPDDLPAFTRTLIQALTQ